MDDMQRMLIEHACSRLSARYGILFDDGDYEGWLGLWARDGIWSLPKAPPIVGREAIRARIGVPRPDRPHFRHLATNIAIDVTDETHATGIVYGLIFRAVRGEGGPPDRMEMPEALVEFRDRYVLEEGKWLFAERLCPWQMAS